MRQVKKLDAMIKIGSVRGAVEGNLTGIGVLLFPPFCREALKEGDLDFPVQLIDIRRVQPRLQTVVFGLEATYGRVVLALLILVAVPQRGRDPLQDLVGEC